MNYYNENDPKAAAWLRELIKQRLIPEGFVDERSIVDVKPNELHGYIQHHFFCGIAGWPLALRLAGWPDDRPVFSASCPCQPFSNAGLQRGAADERHLWPVAFKLIEALNPPVVFGEQVASKAGREWLAGVFADVETLGYRRAGADLCAAGISAPHIRQRLYWVAFAGSQQPGRLLLRPGEGAGKDGSGASGEPGGPSGAGGLDDATDARCAGGGERGEAATARHQARVLQPSGSGASGGVADSSCERRREPGELATAEAVGIRAISGEGDWVGIAGSDSPTNRLEHSAGDGRQQRRAEPSRGSVVSGCGAGGVANNNNNNKGSQGRRCPELREHADELIVGQGSASDWSDYELIPCRDGKQRRIERGSAPLAPGLSGQLVPSGYPSASYAQATAEARVMRLKGYGNAICVPLAAEFILACEEARQGLE